MADKGNVPLKDNDALKENSKENSKENPNDHISDFDVVDDKSGQHEILEFEDRGQRSRSKSANIAGFEIQNSETDETTE